LIIIILLTQDFYLVIAKFN